MANIKASQRDVPLFDVVEHIAGDLGQVVLHYEELDHKDIGLPAAVDFGGKLGRAPVGHWEAPLTVDGAIVHAWDRALADLIGAVRRAELMAKGRPPGSPFLEAISPGDFAEVADNPIADLDSTVGYEGKRVLEFKDTKATIVNSRPIGTPEVMWTDVCAESGAEILKLWPAELIATANLNAVDGVRESERNETTLPPRKQSNPLPPLQERILEIARGLWPDGKLPPRIADRDNQILKKWPGKERAPDRKTIRRAFKNWTPPDNEGMSPLVSVNRV
jgi:hypothetical protein